MPGGALNLNSAVNVTVMSSVFRGNEAQNGGGVCVKQCDRSTFFDNSFTSNWADNSGGALFQLQCNGALQSSLHTFIVEYGRVGAFHHT